jgi:hypothetical protein
MSAEKMHPLKRGKKGDVRLGNKHRRCAVAVAYKDFRVMGKKGCKLSTSTNKRWESFGMKLDEI